MEEQEENEHEEENDENQENPSYEDEEESANAAMAFSTHELPRGVAMTAKIPPGYDGVSSWFVYEESVYDWVDLTSLTPEKQGPALKNRLSDRALFYKTQLDRDKLKSDDGVEYFLRTLRVRFIKGNHAVWLYRLFRFMYLKRGKMDLQRWLLRFDVERNRMKTRGWNYLFQRKRETPRLKNIFKAWTPRTDLRHIQIKSNCSTTLRSERMKKCIRFVLKFFVRPCS